MILPMLVSAPGRVFVVKSTFSCSASSCVTATPAPVPAPAPVAIVRVGWLFVVVIDLVCFNKRYRSPLSLRFDKGRAMQIKKSEHHCCFLSVNTVYLTCLRG